MKICRTVFNRSLLLACALFVVSQSDSWARVAVCYNVPGGTNAYEPGPWCYVYLNDPFDTGANCPQSCVGMPQWSVSEPYCNLWVKDVPLGYQPAKGPAVALQLAYKQRADTIAIPAAGPGKFNNPWSWPWKSALAGEANLPFWKWLAVLDVGYTNKVVGSSLNEFSFGKHWNCDWLSFCATNGSNVQILLPGGGVSDFSGLDARDFISNDRLLFSGGSFRTIAPDGRTNLYGMKATVDNQPRFYLTEMGDRTGRKLTLQYDAQGGNPTYARLRHVIDADGRTNTLHYNYEISQTGWGNVPSPYSPNLVASVVDAFQRTSCFEYSTNGQLTRIRDVQGIESSFTYGTSNWMSTLVTPYGTTTFDASQSVETNDIRALRVTDAGGGNHLWVFRGDLGGIYPERANSFYWGPRQYAQLSHTAVLTNLTAGEYIRGTRKNWEPASAQAHSSLLKQWEFSPDGASPGQQTDYIYPRDASNEVTQLLPSKVERVLPDSTTWFQEMQRDDYGVVRSAVGSYTEPGVGVGSRTNRFDYSADGFNLIATHDAEDHQVLGVTYSNRLPVVVTNVLGEITRFTYNADGQPTGISRPGGLVTTNLCFTSGDYTGWLERTIDLVGGVPQRTNSFTYTNGLVHTHTDERGSVTTHTWDALGRLTSASDGLGTVSNIYDKLDLVRTVDRMGFTNGFRYDAMRRLTDSYDALGRKTHNDYCTCGALESVIDADDNTNTFTYDAGGRQIGVAGPDGYWVTNELNLIGQIVSTTDSGGANVTHSYNNQGLLYQTLNAWGNVGVATFDIQDRVISQTDANNVTVMNAYDVAGRLIERVTPANGAQEFFGYTLNVPGLTSYTNALTNVTRFGYDGFGRQTAETNANQEVTRFTYEPDGALKTLTDGLNHITTWKHDTFGRLTNKADHLGTNAFAYGYDANSRLTARTTPAKGTTAYGYNAVGNLTTVDHPASADLTLQYDALDRLTNLVSAGVFTNAFTYTAAGQLASEAGPWANDTVSYNYENRLRTRMSVAGLSVTNTWEAATKRLTGVASGAGTFGYEYHNAHALRVSQLNLPGGAHIVNSFDDLARLTDTHYASPGSATLNGHGYGHDLGNQRTNQTRIGINFANDVTYEYDKIGQLLAATGREADSSPRLHEQFGYAYDAANNLRFRTNNALVQAFNVNAVNQLTNVTRSGTLTVSGNTSGTTTNVTVNGQTASLYADLLFAKDGFTLSNGTNTFTAIAQNAAGTANTNTISVYLPATNAFIFDANGNMTWDGAKVFEYDDENQLVRITQTNVFKSEFVYDGTGRLRVKKEFDGSGTLQSETRFVYDQMLVIQERDTNNAPLVSYTRGKDLSGGLQGAGGIGGLLARTDHTTTTALFKTAFYHADGNGNVTALLSTNGLVLAWYQYSPFGTTLAQSGPLADANAFRFSSKLWHNRSGLYYYGYRFYSPNLQRWLNADPIQEGGGINLYDFVGNEPVAGVDPFGWSEKNRTVALTCAIVPGLQTELFKQEYYANRPPSDWVPSRLQISIGGDSSVKYKRVTSATGRYYLVVQKGGGDIDWPSTGEHIITRTEIEQEQRLDFLKEAVPLLAIEFGGEFLSLSRCSTAAKVARPRGIPENWAEQAGRKPGNTKWVNPANKHDYVRAKPDGSISQVRDGKAFDANGNLVDLDSSAAHEITPGSFIFRE